jgi:hypothetical protein
MIFKDSNDSEILTIPLDLAGCMVHFNHRLPTAEDMSSLKQYCLTHGDTPWNRPHSLIKWQTSFISKSLTLKVTILI